MQTNDLNKLLAKYEGLTLAEAGNLLNEIHISEIPNTNKWSSIEELKEIKKPISDELFKKVQADVEKFQNLGKKRRWIKRYCKRKYNIEEYL